MKLRFNALLCFALLGLTCLVLPSASKADSFDWTYYGIQTVFPNPPINFGSGELTETNGVITEISGTFDGLAITGLLPPDTFNGNDNLLLLPAAPLYVTANGFSFMDSAGTQYNIIASLGSQCQCTDDGCTSCVPWNVYVAYYDSTFDFDFGDFTLTPIAETPEPSTMAMLLPVALGFALFLLCKRV
jgi:hypothetical protein